MKIEFYKYQGTGNDFVMIDDREEEFDRSREDIVAKLCDRKFGIGADGLILLRNHPVHDFEMVYYNADGKEGSMCGNGGRCIVHFAQFLGLFDQQTTFLAVDGLHEASLAEDWVHLKMGDVKQIEHGEGHFFLDTGSPHYVQFVEDVAEWPVVAEGRSVRESDAFQPGGTNVNFAQQLPDLSLKVRTYERGVEDETLSCGTGVTAVALAASLGGLESPVKIQVPGGNLEIRFQKTEQGFEEIFLCGPAMQVFKGQIEVG